MGQNAKQSRKDKVAQAQKAAQKQLADFRASEQKRFDDENAKLANSDPARELEQTTAQELAMVEADFNSNKDATVEYIVSKVREVNLELTETQKQALQNNL